MISNPFSRSTPGADPQTVDYEDFAQAVKAGTIAVVDVREPQEFAAGHIPNAINLPLSTFDPSRLPSGKPVVLMCGSGKRSLAALNKAQASGRKDVKHYPGGMAGWRAHNGEVA
jgi:rhodanese-related sulfurtransferase